MKILGYILIIWGLADIGLSWIGSDLYYDIGIIFILRKLGIILPEAINPFTGFIAICNGGGLLKIGSYLNEKETDHHIAQINKNKFNKNIQKKKREFSQKDIQEVLDIFITEWGEGSFFNFSISESENIFAQGALNANNCDLEISSKNVLTNPAILDTHKFKQLILLGWEIPNDDNVNFTCEVTIKDVLEDKVAKLLFESLKVFDLPDDKINVTYEIDKFYQIDK